MGMLDDMERDLGAMLTPTTWTSFEEQAKAVEQEDTRIADALTAISTAISAMEMPEIEIDLQAAVKQLITGLAKIRPDHKPLDLTPIIKAIEGVTLTVNVPEVEEREPCPYTFTIVRNDSGLMHKVIAIPGLEEQKPTVAPYEIE